MFNATQLLWNRLLTKVWSGTICCGLTFVSINAVVAMPLARYQEANSEYRKGNSAPLVNALTEINKNMLDQEALKWMRDFCSSDCGQGLDSLAIEHRAFAGAMLEPAVARLSLPEAYFKLAYIWRAAGDKKKYLYWLGKAAEGRFVLESAMSGPRYAKYRYAYELLMIGDAEGAKKWFESSRDDGDASSEDLLIKAYSHGLKDVYNNIPQTALDAWPTNPLRAAQLVEDRAKRTLDKISGPLYPRCPALVDMVEIELGWGGCVRRIRIRR